MQPEWEDTGRRNLYFEKVYLSTAWVLLWEGFAASHRQTLWYVLFENNQGAEGLEQNDFKGIHPRREQNKSHIFFIFLFLMWENFLLGLKKDAQQFWGDFSFFLFFCWNFTTSIPWSNYRGTTLFRLRLCGAAAEVTLIRKACMQERSPSLPFCHWRPGDPDRRSQPSALRFAQTKALSGNSALSM